MALTPEEEQELAELDAQEAAHERQKQAQKPRAPQISPEESYFRGISEALAPATKYPGAAGRYLRGKTVGPELTWEEAVADEEEAARRAREEQGKSFYTGMATGVLGSAIPAAAAAVPKAFGSTLLGGLKYSAPVGAAYEMGDLPYQTVKEQPQALIGAGIKGAAKASLLPVGFEAAARRAPVVEGVKAGVSAMEGKGPIAAPFAFLKEGVPAALGTSQETKQMKKLVQQIAPEVQPQAQTIGEYGKYGSVVSPQEEAQFLLNLLKEGKTPAKEFYTQKATQLYPGQIGPQQLGSVLEMPLEQRVQARGFERAEVGRELLPQAEAAKKVLQGKGKAFEKLQNQAIEEYQGKGLPEVFMALDTAKKAEFSGVSSKARKTVNELMEIIGEGKSLDQGRLQPGDIMEVGNQEAYKRLQTARQWIDDVITTSFDDPSVTKILQPIRKSLDNALKSSPSKALADEMYARGQQVEQVGIRPLEMPLGKGKRAPRELSSAQIKGAFGDTVKGERAQRGIEMARSYAKDFAEQLGPENAKTVSDFFDALANAKSVADRKRILDQLKFAEGPSGAAIRAGIEKLQQTIKPAPGGASMFRAAPEYLQSVDAFMADQARKQFGKPFDKLTGKEQLKLVNAFQWFKENPNATQDEIAQAFSRIMKGPSK